MGAHLVSVDCWPDTPCATKVCGRTLRRVNGDLSCLHQLSFVLAVMPARQHVTKFVCERPLRPMQDCGESNASHERSTTQQTVWSLEPQESFITADRIRLGWAEAATASSLD